MNIVDVVVPIVTKSTNVKLRQHWRKSAAASKAERQAAALFLRASGNSDFVRTVTHPLVVEMTRLSERTLDDDNVRGALKAIRDEVAAWIGVDDKDPRVTWVYFQQKQKRGHFGVRIVVTALTSAPQPLT